MIAQSLKPETAAAAVIPAEPKHARALRALSLQTYHASAKDAAVWFQPEEYLSRIQMFPEGQFVAVQQSSGEIVGFTSGMRFHFDPTTPLLDSWDNTTGYG
jgi:hypothetical protein